ncbi:hypothetical protein [Ktedonobacter sp. SOSP1-85]|uniref:hypothetical protein n=1 Tax=Ktedonobacter sp. SOSP1-85 TaxID=2778367 RepID=UPI00191691B5|nr:hypothetical protein [Ktedonobacter sp. SOSP1-85]
MFVREQATDELPELDLEQIRWGQIMEFLFISEKRKRLHEQLPPVPPDELWTELTDENNGGPLSSHPQQDRAIKDTVPVPYLPLEQKLLALGGRRMVYQSERTPGALLERGEVCAGTVELVPGEASECHINSADLWNQNRQALAIVTGYGLSEDGLWRQHSWLIRRDPEPGKDRIIETTVARIMYFGVVLNDNEAQNFLDANV